MKQRVGLVDMDTGEVLEEKVLFIGNKPYRVDRGYIKVFVSFLYDVVDDREVAGKSIRLLLYMLSKIDFNTYEMIVLPQDAMRELQISKQTYYNWLDTLIDRGFIERVDRYKYRLRPYIAVKGQTAKVRDIREG